MSKGVELIAQERLEQIQKHGFTLKNDEFYRKEQLIQAAIYCLCSNIMTWPTGWDRVYELKILQKDRTQQLIVAGALIAAELDRITSEKNQNDRTNIF